ncbi:MAG: PGF-CTERM sorting domain-containing protein [Halolamina sp.]
MDREQTFAVGAVLVVGVALLSAVLAPGVLADPTSDEGPVRPGHVEVVGAAVSTGEVTGQRAELTLHATLRHRGNPTENVSVRFRAIDTESGLLAAEKRIQVGAMRNEGERAVPATLTVEREGGYRLEAVVYRNDTRIDSFARTVSGVSALTPAYAESNVSFTDDAVLDPVSVSVVETSDDRTTLELGGWLTAAGPSEGDDLSLTFVVRQAESNVVAARTTVEAGDIREGRSRMVTAQVSVPSEYNYYIDAVLTRDGVIIDTATGVVNLDPTETIDANRTEREVEFNAGEFAETGGTEAPERTPAEAMTEGEVRTEAPGFGPAVAVGALLAAVLLVRWRR